MYKTVATRRNTNGDALSYLCRSFQVSNDPSMQRSGLKEVESTNIKKRNEEENKTEYLSQEGTFALLGVFHIILQVYHMYVCN